MSLIKTKQIDLVVGTVELTDGNLVGADQFPVVDDGGENPDVNKRILVSSVKNYMESNINALASNALTLGSGAATLKPAGGQTLTIQSGTDVSGTSILLADGVNAAITLSPRGTQGVNLPAGYDGRSGLTDNSLMPKAYIDGLVNGVDWKEAVKVKSSRALESLNDSEYIYQANLGDGTAGIESAGNEDHDPNDFGGRSLQIGDRVLVSEQEGQKGFWHLNVNEVPAADDTLATKMSCQGSIFGHDNENLFHFLITFTGSGGHSANWDYSGLKTGAAAGTAFAANIDISVATTVNAVAAQLRVIFDGPKTNGRLVSKALGGDSHVRVHQIAPYKQVDDTTNPVPTGFTLLNLSNGNGYSAYNGIFEVKAVGQESGGGAHKVQLRIAPDALDPADARSNSVFVTEGQYENLGYVNTFEQGRTVHSFQKWIEFTGVAALNLPDNSGLNKTGNDLKIEIDSLTAPAELSGDDTMLVQDHSGNRLAKMTVTQLSSFQAGSASSGITASNGALKADWRAMKRNKLDPSSGTNASGVLKFDNIFTGTLLPLAAGHPQINNFQVYVNGVLDTDINNCTNMNGGAISGDNQISFRAGDDNNIDLYIKLTGQDLTLDVGGYGLDLMDIYVQIAQ